MSALCNGIFEVAHFIHELDNSLRLIRVSLHEQESKMNLDCLFAVTCWGRLINSTVNQTHVSFIPRSVYY